MKHSLDTTYWVSVLQRVLGCLEKMQWTAIQMYSFSKMNGTLGIWLSHRCRERVDWSDLWFTPGFFKSCIMLLSTIALFFPSLRKANLPHSGSLWVQGCGPLLCSHCAVLVFQPLMLSRAVFPALEVLASVIFLFIVHPPLIQTY